VARYERSLPIYKSVATITVETGDRSRRDIMADILISVC